MFEGESVSLCVRFIVYQWNTIDSWDAPDSSRCTPSCLSRSVPTLFRGYIFNLIFLCPIDGWMNGWSQRCQLSFTSPHLSVSIFTFSFLIFLGFHPPAYLSSSFYLQSQVVIANDFIYRNGQCWGSERILRQVHQRSMRRADGENTRRRCEVTRSQCVWLFWQPVGRYTPSRRSFSWLKIKKDYLDGATGECVVVGSDGVIRFSSFLWSDLNTFRQIHWISFRLERTTGKERGQVTEGEGGNVNCLCLMIRRWLMAL